MSNEKKLFVSSYVALVSAVSCTSVTRAATLASFGFENPVDPSEAQYDGDYQAAGFSVSTNSATDAIRLLDPSESQYLGALNVYSPTDPTTAIVRGTPVGGEGAQAVRLFVDGSNLPAGGAFTALTSTDSFAVTSGSSYSLTAAYGDGFDIAQSTSYRIELIDAVTGATVATSIDQPAPTFDAFFTDTTAGTFQQLAAAAYTPTSDGSVKIRLTVLSSSPFFRDGDFDNVQLNSSAVPEPTTAVMAALVGAGTLLRRRRVW